MNDLQPALAAQDQDKLREKPDRRYPAIACVACRKRKIKCDNAKPKCSNCRLYSADCLPGGDKRRRSSALQAISVLNSRIEGLEGQLAERQSGNLRQGTSPKSNQQKSPSNETTHGARPDALRRIVSESATNQQDLDLPVELGFEGLLTNYWNPEDGDDFLNLMEPAANGKEVALGYESHTYGTVPNGEDIWHDQGLFAAHHNLYSDTHQTNLDAFEPVNQEQSFPIREDASWPPANETSARTLLAETPADLDEDELTQRLSSRVGQLKVTENGQLRYYGVTSNLHMMGDGLLSLFQPNVRTARSEGEAAITQAGLAWEEDVQYEQHLFDLYFAWHDPFLQETPRDLFFSEKTSYKNGADSSFYSPALENAMLSVGALYSPLDHSAVKSNPSDFFASRAKAYLDVELDSPSIATVQAVLVLSCYEAANGRDSRGWIYVGMAAQIITDLGIHANIEVDSKYMHGNIDAQKTAALRKNAFWCAYTAELFWSFYSGRPALMASLRHNVPCPSPVSNYQWKAYIDRYQNASTEPPAEVTILGMVPPCLTTLAMKMGRIAAVLYTGIPDTVPDAQSFVQSMTQELQQWKASLPPALDIDTSRPNPNKEKDNYLPMVIQLHMQYHATVVLLHRPFVSECVSPSAIMDQPLNASQICSQSASAISYLLMMFRRRFSWRYVHLQAVHNATIAGVVHAYDACIFPGERGKRAQEDLNVCIQALGEMAQSFKSSTRGYEVIAAVRREWQIRKFSHAGSKRSGGPTSKDGKENVSGRQKLSSTTTSHSLSRTQA